MKLNIYMLQLLFLLCFLQVNAQNNTDFNLTGHVLDNYGNELKTNSTFIKKGNVLQWIQNNNGIEDVINFSVVSSSGNWDVNTSLGNLSCQMTLDSEECELIIIGETTGISASLIFKLDGEEDKYVISVNNITY